MFPRRQQSFSFGFTLIELLIVIAIILILIAIALPNFLEAQIRARATKASSEIRSIGIALEAYYLDWDYYPFEHEHTQSVRGPGEDGLFRLTTPTAYITQIPEDPFPGRNSNDQPGDTYTYYGGGCRAVSQTFFPTLWGPIYAVWSQGPSQNGATIPATHPNIIEGGGEIVSYSATNGTKSEGTIHLFTGEGVWWGVNTRLPPGQDVCDPTKLSNPSLNVGLIVDKVVYLRRRPPNSYE